MRRSCLAATLLVGLLALVAGEQRAPAPPRPTIQSSPSGLTLVGDVGQGVRLWGDKQCAACHGATALGGVGKPLANTGLAFDRFLSQIRNALPPKPAMSTQDLSDEEAYSIFLWLRTLSPAAGKASLATSAPLPAGQILGIQLWTDKGCNQCHGAFAQGSVQGPALAGEAYPFERQRAVMRQAVSNPAHSPQNVSDDELARLLDWLRRGADPVAGC
jgi:mono/diheme cytochrome c family protein